MEHKVITLGYDVKITPEGKPYIIEINGKRSGLKGLEKIADGKVERCRRDARLKIIRQFDVNVREDVFGKKWEDLEYLPEFVSLGTKEDGVSIMSERYLKFLRKPEAKQWELLKKMYIGFLAWALSKREVVSEISEYFSEENLQKPFNPKEMMGKILGQISYMRDKECGEIFIVAEQTTREAELMKDFIEFYFQHKIPKKSKVMLIDEHLLGKVWFNPKHYVVGANDEYDFSIMEKPFLKFRGRMAQNSDELEEVCEDKLKQKEWIPKDFQVFYQEVECPFDPREFLKMMEGGRGKFSDELVVAKKIKGGNCGNEVKIINVKDPANRAIFKSELWSGYEGEPILMEGFVPSKKIYCDETGDYHDGCMRYLVDLHVQKKRGKLIYEPIYEAGYWRLAPVGLNGKGILNDQERQSDAENCKYKANLANGAIPAKAYNGDLEMARKAVMTSVEMIMAKPEVF